MDSTTGQPRKRPGRPPKSSIVGKLFEPISSNEDSNASGNCNVGLVQEELSGEAALVAISPILVEQTCGTTSSGAMDSLAECRRSSRKKIIKFDVRDLLNKHRRPHKIQIEARIDSNAPSTGSKAATSTTTGNSSSVIEKISIIQRPQSSVENTQHITSQVLIPLAPEIYKPNQSSSLIVAQMQSSDSSTEGKSRRPTITNLNEKCKIYSGTEEVTASVPKRRGRPPKNRMQEILQKSKANELIDDTTDTKNVLITTGLGSSKIDTVSEMNLVLATASDIEIKNIKIEVCKEKDESQEKDKLFNTKDGNIKQKDKSEERTDSVAKEENYLSSFSTKSLATMSNITLPPKKQISKYKELQAELETECLEVTQTNIKDESENDDQVIFSGTTLKEEIVELESPSNSSYSQKDFVDDPAVSAAMRRTERRSGRRPDDGPNSKTLEETFAAIAASTSRAVLEETISSSYEEKVTGLSDEALSKSDLKTTISEAFINESIIILDEVDIKEIEPTTLPEDDEQKMIIIPLKENEHQSVDENSIIENPEIKSVSNNSKTQQSLTKEREKNENSLNVKEEIISNECVTEQLEDMALLPKNLESETVEISLELKTENILNEPVDFDGNIPAVNLDQAKIEPFSEPKESKPNDSVFKEQLLEASKSPDTINSSLSEPSYKSNSRKQSKESSSNKNSDLEVSHHKHRKRDENTSSHKKKNDSKSSKSSKHRTSSTEKKEKSGQKPLEDLSAMASPLSSKEHRDKKLNESPVSSKSKLKLSSNDSASKDKTSKHVSLSKKSDSKSHKDKNKHKGDSSERKDSKSREIESSYVDVEKQKSRKERQNKLKEAFQNALNKSAENKKEVSHLMSKTTPPITQPLTPDRDVILSTTPSVTIPAVMTAEKNEEPDNSSRVAEADPLYDIEKFIEAGVNLLKRDYKVADDDKDLVTNLSGVPQNPVEETTTPESIELQPEINIKTELEIPNSERKSPTENALLFYETPASTPASTPAATTPSSSPTPTDTSVDTYYYSDGVRRSHRLKKMTNVSKALVGRGLVETKSYHSIEDHLLDLAEVEAKNAKFLKEMEQRLSNFEVIKENQYHCERVVSREARRMICDCFLTPEEADRGELGCGEDCLNRLLMIECGSHCKVGERCTNKRFQKYLCAPCRVFRTEKKGFGIMADVEIQPGEFIMEYVGEVLDSDEFEDRRNAYSQDKNRHYYFMALRSDAIIDATIKGNISRFINHSCDPNAETQKWTVNGELRIGFFSRKSIMPGEEITFDYQYQRYGREAQRCYCESANCRGWIGEEPNSDEGEQVEDDEEEDYDEEEDENDVVSMVKGLMSVEEGEDDEEKDALMSEETRRTLENAAVKAQMRKNQLNAAADIKADLDDAEETDESKRKFMAYLSKISAKIEIHKQNVREEKKRKRQQRKKTVGTKISSKTAAARFLEDPDLEDEIDFLSRCGLKNQSDTLRLSRLMVRAKLATTRLNLLTILRSGELPCRRLFLDYHGLHLLHGWINEDGRTDMNIRLALLQTLECLPIPNKNILTDSKVYQAVRNWSSTSSGSENLPNATPNEGSSSSPSDESSKESASVNLPVDDLKVDDPNLQSTTVENEQDSVKVDIEKLASQLVNSWDNLPEIFRIPKRERIEQMKEHEREADLQYAATVEAFDDQQKEVSTDRYQRDRFERRFGRPHGSRPIAVLGTANNLIGGTTSKRQIGGLSDVIPTEDTKHLSKEQRRELFAAKVARDEAEKRMVERRREFETKCNFFGLDVRMTRPEDIPFCVSDSGQWFNERRQHIAIPPAFAHAQTPVKPMSTNPADYYLPAAVNSLPSEWKYAITGQGKIYYYHVKHRIPQWEPPTENQISQTKWTDSEDESEIEDNNDAEELTEERIKEIESIETQEDLNVLLKKIIQEQRSARYKRLVDERPISPRREEDRIYNQMEMRKYKENKEKIKKRKEEIRRRRSEMFKNSNLNMHTLGPLDDVSNNTSNVNENSSSANVDNNDLPVDAIPIQEFLLSSDDEGGDIDEMKAECNNSPLLEKIVEGDKIVDELDALTTNRQLKRPLPPHRDVNFEANSVAGPSSSVGVSSLENSSNEKMDHKKRKQEKKDKSKRSKESSDAKYRKLKEKFRCEIAGIIVQHLKPYRKDSCVFGHIRSNEDFNHLAKKLTHFVMIKELKYCESVGQTLVVTESVKNKSREFIKKYMAKYERGYVKSDNDPEFKDIPFKL